MFRRRELGFVFQSFNLLNTLTVKENILALALDGVDLDEMNRRVGILAEKLGITSILDKRTYEISGTGARTAVARAMIHVPKLVLADEPTGNLDSKSARDVMEIMDRRNKEDKVTMRWSPMTRLPQATAIGWCLSRTVSCTTKSHTVRANRPFTKNHQCAVVAGRFGT